MTTSFRYVRSLLASLVLFAAAGSTAAGCSAEECTYVPSTCPFVDFDSFCGPSDGCTVDGAAASCQNGKCTFDLTQKLVIPLEKAKVTRSMPDLTIRLASTGPIEHQNVIVTIDGIPFPPAADISASEPVWVDWSDWKRASDPKTLEISFAEGSGPVTVSVSFADSKCQASEVEPCPGDA